MNCESPVSRSVSPGRERLGSNENPCQDGVNRRNILRVLGAGATLGALAACKASLGERWVGTWSKEAAARELAAHRISRMVPREMQDRYSHWVGPNAQHGPAGWGRRYRIRSLDTDRGAHGWAMSYWEAGELDEFLGARVGDLYDLDQGAMGDAWKLDIVLHDLVANILGVSVRDLLGAKGPPSLLAYSASIYMEDVWPRDDPKGIDAILRSCQIDHDLGYRAFKLKIGRGAKRMDRRAGLERDIAVTWAVRERFPNSHICVDANDSLSVDETVAYVKGAAGADLYFIEEPFVEGQDGLKKLRSAMFKFNCRALVCEGESRSERASQRWRYGGYTQEHIDRLFRLADDRLIDIVNLDLGLVGFTNWRRIMPELVRVGLTASPHTWAATPRAYYAAQLGGGLGNVAIAEGIPGGAADIDYSAYRFDAGGRLVLPLDRPGFGLTLRA